MQKFQELWCDLFLYIYKFQLLTALVQLIS